MSQKIGLLALTMALVSLFSSAQAAMGPAQLVCSSRKVFLEAGNQLFFLLVSPQADPRSSTYVQNYTNECAFGGPFRIVAPRDVLVDGQFTSANTFLLMALKARR